MEVNSSHFCVISGKEYVIKVAALHHSLQQNTSNYTLWICCVDSETYKLLMKMNLGNTILLKVEDIEDDQLREIKQKRSTKEYCWTLKPVFIEHVLTKYDVPAVLYCDGDLFFFSDPKPIFEEWGEDDVLLCLQRDADWVHEKYGFYQAGLIGFKQVPSGLESLLWWKEKCLEWCSALPEQDKFGDQKYLDQLPVLFSNITISEHLGVDAAPWNCIFSNNFTLTASNDEVYIEEDRLIVFHFACISLFSENEFDLWTSDPLPFSRFMMKHIYEPYLECLISVMNKVQAIDPNGLSLYVNQDRSHAQTFYHYQKPTITSNGMDRQFQFATIISHEYLIKGLALYQSLAERSSHFHLWICCMDDSTYETLSRLKLERATILHVKDVENEQLRQVKSTRKLYEYCWTLKAPLCLYLFDLVVEMDHIVYCDADMFFFAAPDTIFEEWGNASVFLCRQRGTPELEKLHGTYQAGLIGFRRDEHGMKTLRWWNDQCLDNCFDIYETDSWGDQKYLDRIPHLFFNFTIIEPIGINAAPWNLVMSNQHALLKKENQVWLDDSPLIAFHFGSMLILEHHEFDLWKLEPLVFNQSVIDFIYVPYIESLQQACQLLTIRNAFDHSLFYTPPSGTYSPKNHLKR